jgi:hypothetical protein
MATIYRYEIQCEKENNVYGAYTASSVFTREKQYQYEDIRNAMCIKHHDDTHPKKF